MKRIFALVLAMVGSGLARDMPPTPPCEAFFPEWRAVTNEASARVLFSPMAGTPRVESPVAGNVLLPVNFLGTKHERVSWDISVKADLRGTRGIQFLSLIHI